MAKLRELQDKARADAEVDKKKAAKKEKKKRRGDGAGAGEGRDLRPPKRQQGDLETGQKALEDVYSSTGLDPDPVRRKKALKRAKRLGKSKKKKKKKSSSSTEGAESC